MEVIRIDISKNQPLRGQRKAKKERTVECRQNGLSACEVAENAEKYGKNELTRKKKDTFLKQLLRSFNDPIIKILIGALVINALASFGRINWAESLGIVAAILIATMVSTVSEYTSSLAYSRLSESSETGKCTVRRSGQLFEIYPSEIVTGDRVILVQGMTVPADGILSKGCITCDQSALTGESREITKTASNISTFDPDSFDFELSDQSQVFRASAVIKGSGEMTVIRVGDKTFIGEIAGSLQDSQRPSPLKHRLSELAKTIGFMGYVGAAMIAFAYLFNSFFIDSGMDLVLVRERFLDIPFLISEVLRAVTVAVSVVVVAVPEGLPMMITVVLSSNMKKMMRGGVLVRRLVGIETAGNLNILFTDKTGTLTSGKMSVTEVTGIDTVSKVLLQNKAEIPNIRLISQCIGASCSPYGSATERALCAFARENVKTEKKIPFDSKNKYSAGLFEDKMSFFAGAPEVLLEHCTFAYDKNGERIALDTLAKREIQADQNTFSQNACRVLCLAVGDGCSFECAEKGTPSHLTFLCLVAMRDPVREDVKRSVRDCHSAGVQVVIITGDNAETARAVARETGILTDKCKRVLSANELHRMSDIEITEILSEIAVVARALPSDKIRLVRIAEESGKVVGMTGDGINDAPALKAADVGFAMGSGTDIAKDAGDVVITDDSFASITRAVLYGRTIFQSIRKFVVFQLMMNLSAMGISLIGPFIGIDSPVTVIQMLWVNIIMDTLGGLAFAGEPAMRKYMLRSSPPRDAKIISKRMLSQILITGGYTLALGIFFLKSPLIRSLFGGDDTYRLTAFFAMFIFCGIFNSFNARTESANIFSCIAGNKPFVFIMTLVAAVQLLIIYFGGEVFRCTPLEPVHLLYASLIALTVIPADIIRKLVFRRR
ncbi:MAG: calcium-translocating P-type ATPase, PMCA-type [Clostridia bacterium]|nr:calcium-translocating P-type ATPase, PMCA-type [Clostridia bacterium]